MDRPRSLPEDLLLEILLRLPVESILRFKCVCKCWYAPIKSPSFMAKHFSHESNRAHLFICNLKTSYNSRPSIVFSVLPDKIVAGVTPEHKTLLQFSKITYFSSIFGPVNGLFLVQKSSIRYGISLALWNPVTKEFRPLPPAPFEVEHSDQDNKFGFGLDLLTQDYKVVWIRLFWNEFGEVSRVLVSVFSFRNNSWKNLIPEFPFSCLLSPSLSATYLNGVYYWLCLDLGEILSFDMGNEQFGKIQGPGPDITSEKWGTLTLLGDSLVILAGDPYRTFIYNVWSRNQEGNWTKVLTIQPPPFDAHWPRGIWEREMIIFELSNSSQLVIYDPTTREITDLGFELDIHLGRCWVFNYKESLFPLESRNYIHGQDNVVDQIDHFISTAQASVNV